MAAMTTVIGPRITDPVEIWPAKIAADCRTHGRLIVQFTRSAAYTPATLSLLNDACRLAQDRLQVRFFGHYGGGFDAESLRYLPHVRDLSVDCLTEIVHEEQIGQLPKLIRLSFGVFDFDRPGFLNTMDLGGLERLVLSENRKRNIDLTPLAQCGSLSELFVGGHTRGIGAIAALPRLQKLGLGAYAKAHGLDFISAISSLRDLTLILGGRTDIDDMSSASLEALQVVRVCGLSGLGDLSRFTSLSALRVEDQLQLVHLDLTGANLERLWLNNCKKLAELTGLEKQERLREFRASGVALDMDYLRDREWPPTARSINLFAGSRKWNDDTEACLSARGIGEKGELWP